MSARGEGSSSRSPRPRPRLPGGRRIAVLLRSARRAGPACWAGALLPWADRVRAAARRARSMACQVVCHVRLVAAAGDGQIRAREEGTRMPKTPPAERYADDATGADRLCWRAAPRSGARSVRPLPYLTYRVRRSSPSLSRAPSSVSPTWIEVTRPARTGRRAHAERLCLRRPLAVRRRDARDGPLAWYLARDGRWWASALMILWCVYSCTAV